VAIGVDLLLEGGNPVQVDRAVLLEEVLIEALPMAQKVGGKTEGPREMAIGQCLVKDGALEQAITDAPLREAVGPTKMPTVKGRARVLEKMRLCREELGLVVAELRVVAPVVVAARMAEGEGAVVVDDTEATEKEAFSAAGVAPPTIQRTP